MKIINSRKKESCLEKINRLIESSFGKGWKANYYPDATFTYQFPYVRLKEMGRPVLVGKQTFFSKKIVGQMGACIDDEGDGTVMRILVKYESQAKRYAKLFESETGKEVNIEIVDNIDLQGLHYHSSSFRKQSVHPGAC